MNLATKVALVWLAAKDRIPGGLADKRKPSDFDSKALAKGVKVEMEHTSDKDVAREIAMDHLTEDENYYDKLETIEKHAQVYPPARNLDKGLEVLWKGYLQKMARAMRVVESSASALDNSDVEYVLGDLGIRKPSLKSLRDFYREVQSWWNPSWDSQTLTRYLLDNLRRVDPFRRDIRGFIQKVQSEDFERKAEDLGVLWDSKYEEGIPPRDLHDLALLAVALKGVLEASTSVEKRLEATHDKKMVREDARLEKVFHASIYAKKIYQTGFAMRVPEQAGLGGSQDSNSGKGTSFTYDRFVAKEIVRGLREMAMIANGELDAATVVRMINRERLAESVSLHLSLPRGVRMEVVAGSLKFFSLSGVALDPRAALPDPAKVAWLYKAYLASQRGKRYDPYFMHVDTLISKLKGVNPRDIGYVEATVDMSHPGILVNHGEREIRVPPEAIVSIDRLHT